MTIFQSDFLQTLSERGFIHQISDAENLDILLKTQRVNAYQGFDCTAASLHVGNLTGIMMMYWLQQTGHRPVVLMGGGTTLIGDPSGRDESRQFLTPETIEANKNSIKTAFAKLLKFGDNGNDAIMVDNADWLLDLHYVEFLRDYGQHFSINAMLQRDAVRLRLEREQHLSFLEFSYMVLQAYDYVELAKRHDCRLQLGGSDQWGNIVSGVDLGRRKGTEQLFALTCPLLTTSSGAKMGKSADGAMWLNGDMLSPYDYWQFWRNSEDDDVERFMKIYTILPMDEIQRYGALEGNEINEAKKVLATEATALIHGREAAERAAETARKTFEDGAAASGLPTLDIASNDLTAGIGLLSAFVQGGLAQSNGEARRHVQGGAVRLNDMPINDASLILTTDHLNEDGVIKLSIGKKKHMLIRASS